MERCSVQTYSIPAPPVFMLGPAAVHFGENQFGAQLSDARSAISAALQGNAGTLGGTNTKMQFEIAGIKTHTELGVAGRVCDEYYNNDFCSRQAIDW